MADTKISALTGVTTPAGTDEFAINQGGTSFKVTQAQLRVLQTGEKLTGVHTDGPVILAEGASSSNPNICPRKADEATGIGSFATGRMDLIATTEVTVRIGGNVRGEFAANYFRMQSAGASFRTGTPSATVPSVVPRDSDPNTGLGHVNADQLVLVAGGVAAVHYLEDGGITATHQLTTGIVANTTQDQANATLLKSTYNVVTTVAVTSDGIRMPSAVAGMMIYIFNLGANNLKLYPFSGDNFVGVATDTEILMGTGASSMRVLLALDTTEWAEIVDGNLNP